MRDDVTFLQTPASSTDAFSSRSMYLAIAKHCAETRFADEMVRRRKEEAYWRGLYSDITPTYVNEDY